MTGMQTINFVVGGVKRNLSAADRRKPFRNHANLGLRADGQDECRAGNADAQGSQCPKAKTEHGNSVQRPGTGRKGTMRVLKFRATNWVLLIVCMMYLVTYVDRVNIATAAAPMQRDLGLTNTQLGLAISAFAYPYAAFQIAGGWLGERLGPSLTLLVCG